MGNTPLKLSNIIKTPMKTFPCPKVQVRNPKLTKKRLDEKSILKGTRLTSVSEIFLFPEVHCECSTLIQLLRLYR